ncbi:MAG: hypothetical protein CMI56_00880, partial [Parcubacteria group bacterium]|nr:hypothetical protein [Parcubacteria group bacterium]
GLRCHLGEFVSDVRGRGLMVGCEFAETVPKGTSGAISKACYERGMLLLPTGHRETLRFVPSLVVTESEVEECLDIFGDAMNEVLGSSTVLEEVVSV